jgi:aspartate/methionine/tyrosine aminotransferase
MKLLARARELEAAGRDIVHMEIGEPDFPTPAPVLEAAAIAIAGGDVHYTPATGLPGLREAIAAHYRSEYGLTIAPGRIIVTPGASGALLLVLGLLVDRDAGVLMADPGYPCNRNFVRFLEGQPCAVPVDAETGYQLTAELVRQHWAPQTSTVIVASPANPTGTTVEQDELAAIARAVRERGGHLVVDEIYHGLVYDGQASSALAVSDEVFVINSFSKFFNMTGWRVGWLVAPERHVEALDRLAQNLFLAAPTPAQHAALAALGPQTRKVLEARREEFRARRDYLLPALRELGFAIPVAPRGAFYLYADCSAFTDDSFEFTGRLLEQAGVAITPGCDFGEHRAARHVRFAYTTGLERLREGVRRLSEFLA